MSLEIKQVYRRQRESETIEETFELVVVRVGAHHFSKALLNCALLSLRFFALPQTYNLLNKCLIWAKLAREYHLVLSSYLHVCLYGHGLYGVCCS